MKNLLLTLALLSFSLQAQNSCQPPVYYFNNMSVVSGTGDVNSVYRFNDVLTGIDAFITITKIQNASISNTSMDNTSGYAVAWQPFITFPSAMSNASDSSYMEFKVEFKSGSSPFNLVDQNCMAMGIVDCDGTGNSNQYREFIKVTKPGTPMAVQNSTLTVFEDSKWILFKSGSSQFNNIDTNNSAAMGQVSFPTAVNSFTVRMGVIGPVGSNTTRQFSLYFKSFAALNVPLPVHLADFKANQAGDDVLLNWVSTNEINFREFEIYKSVNGLDFTYLTSVAGNGGAHQVSAYTYNDYTAAASSSRIFYIMKLIDNNGASVWSNMAHLESLQIANQQVGQIYPNPVNSILHIEMAEPENAGMLRITDIYGKEILKEEFNSPAANRVSLELGHLEKGLYLIHISYRDGTENSIRFIKN